MLFYSILGAACVVGSLNAYFPDSSSSGRLFAGFAFFALLQVIGREE